MLLMKDHIDNGIDNFQDLQKETKIGKSCSSCKTKNKKRFKKYLEKVST